MLGLILGAIFEVGTIRHHPAAVPLYVFADEVPAICGGWPLN